MTRQEHPSKFVPSDISQVHNTEVGNRFPRRLALGIAGLALAAGVAAIAIHTIPQGQQQAAASAAVPVSVAVVEERDASTWDQFSGRLEAIERVEIRPRVAGTIEAVHFREGALVKEGDSLFTIDPAPFAAEVERAEAQVVAGQARVALTQNEMERGQQLWTSRAISQKDLDQRTNAQREAEANLRAAEAALKLAQLNLDYTNVRAPVSGRIGKIEVTRGNLVAAGPGAPVLTTLVSIDPIYASFNADEPAVLRALKATGASTTDISALERIPVELGTVTTTGTPISGHIQLVDNQVDTRSGTVRVRAVFANNDGALIPGQFARIRMGHVDIARAIAINERAIGTDQDKKYVLVVDRENKSAYREVTLGEMAGGLRVVTNGLKAGEHIVVNGLQRVRPGSPVTPSMVSMDNLQASSPPTEKTAQK